jgi:hypothetical protein
MNIFGAREHIAVQAELEPAGQSVVGHICLWADGMQIGSYEEAVLLGPIADFLRGTIRHRDLRIDAEFANLPPEEVLEAVKKEFSHESRGEEKPALDSRRPRKRYSRLVICPNGCEAFDGEWAVLINRDEGESFIWQDFMDKSVRELRLSPGEYDDVVRSFLGWVDPLTGHDPTREHLAGKTFVVMGKFSRPQSEIIKLVRRFGGRVEHTVREGTSYVLVGDFVEEPQHVVKARELGVPILTEVEFERQLPAQRDESKPS